MMNTRLYSIKDGDVAIYDAILARFNWSKRQRTKMATLHPTIFNGTLLLHVDEDDNVTKMRTHRQEPRDEEGCVDAKAGQHPASCHKAAEAIAAVEVRPRTKLLTGRKLRPAADNTQHKP